MEGKILEFHPDTIDAVRKEVNLDTNERMEEAVDILEEWVKKQTHFVKRDFPRMYLESTLITAKGLVERAKQRIDKLCTFKTLMPDFYPSNVTRETFASIDNVVTHAHIPKLTKQHYRVYLMKLISEINVAAVLGYYRYLVVASEYLKMNDYTAGFVIMLDFRDANILSFVTKIGPVELGQIVTLMTDGYGMRIKRIDIISDSKMVDSLVFLFKQVLSAKLSQRIQVHKNLEVIHEVVGKDLLPEEYGGKEMPLRKLNEKWLDILCSKENVEFYKEINQARTDESCRQADKFNENYIGTPGSFRALSVD
ncbi:uncharacterized protein LOC142981832 [Anticarsia gemmatalis]|uniref:uncharacterized protein LOC142981832 n=1 Tax=Anticarsia gemmatalis TaxID=129554 RepID=UPI003F76799A